MAVGDFWTINSIIYLRSSSAKMKMCIWNMQMWPVHDVTHDVTMCTHYVLFSNVCIYVLCGNLHKSENSWTDHRPSGSIRATQHNVEAHIDSRSFATEIIDKIRLDITRSAYIFASLLKNELNSNLIHTVCIASTKSKQVVHACTAWAAKTETTWDSQRQWLQPCGSNQRIIAGPDVFWFPTAFLN